MPEPEPPLSGIPGVPLYVQVRESLRQKIAQGAYKRGQRIPSEEELGAQYRVSRMTIRKAIADLIDDDLLYRSHGVGTFVTQLHIDRDHTRLTDFFEEASAKGLAAQARLLSKARVPAAPRVAEALGLKEGDPVMRIESVRFLDGEPITLHRAYVPDRLWYELSGEELTARSLWTLLEQRHAFKVKHALEKFEARVAGQNTARVLQLEPTSPILYKERTVFAEDGTPVEYEECRSRGDKYACNVILRR